MHEMAKLPDNDLFRSYIRLVVLRIMLSCIAVILLIYAIYSIKAESQEPWQVLWNPWQIEGVDTGLVQERISQSVKPVGHTCVVQYTRERISDPWDADIGTSSNANAGISLESCMMHAKR